VACKKWRLIYFPNKNKGFKGLMGKKYSPRPLFCANSFTLLSYLSELTRNIALRDNLSILPKEKM